MILRLPLYNRGNLEYSIVSERKPCSESCLLNYEDFVAFHMPGLGGDCSHLNYPLITKRSTLVKMKNKEKRKWNRLSYNFEIDPYIQDSIYKKLIDHPIEGLVTILKECKCCYEMEFVNGKLSNSGALPITKYYNHHFSVDTDWNYNKLINFVEQSSQILKELHDLNIIHGDVTTQNFIIGLDNEVTLIDLDNVMISSSNLISQEIVSYIFYTILPILRTFENNDRTSAIISNLVRVIDHMSSGVDWARYLINIFEKRETLNNANPFISAYFYDLDILERVVENNYSLVNRTQQLQTEILESNRVKDNALQTQTEVFREQLSEASNYARTLEISFNEADQYAKSLEKKINEATNYALSLEENVESCTNYAKSLEEKLREVTEYTETLEVNRKESTTYIESLNDEIINIKNQYSSLERELTNKTNQLSLLEDELQMLYQIIREKSAIIDRFEEKQKKPFLEIFKRNRG
ncbi:hypothetical protein [Paenibacillus sp. MSJ-34]|uniref:hypothetical protein n=1 Tax=Paenibacillus sp. MSJ-34 TaxID=2841529 RepID=UPI001C112796|nr:hypothetical protein [Paenibacillus sp. MSJ-34]MBU5444374.1 hypothetical protein [Paenibacillus sp. MSJ-34]